MRVNKINTKQNFGMSWHTVNDLNKNLARYYNNADPKIALECKEIAQRAGKASGKELLLCHENPHGGILRRTPILTLEVRHGTMVYPDDFVITVKNRGNRKDLNALKNALLKIEQEAIRRNAGANK